MTLLDAEPPQKQERWFRRFKSRRRLHHAQYTHPGVEAALVFLLERSDFPSNGRRRRIDAQAGSRSGGCVDG